jgi:hypothetical protein
MFQRTMPFHNAPKLYGIAAEIAAQTVRGKSRREDDETSRAVARYLDSLTAEEIEEAAEDFGAWATVFCRGDARPDWRWLTTIILPHVLTANAIRRTGEFPPPPGQRPRRKHFSEKIAALNAA